MSAVNGIGWEIQRFYLPEGWLAVSPSFPEKEMAEELLRQLNEVDHGCEVRVYETLAVEQK